MENLKMLVSESSVEPVVEDFFVHEKRELYISVEEWVFNSVYLLKY